HAAEVHPARRREHPADAGLAELPDEPAGFLGVGAGEAVGVPAQDGVDGRALPGLLPAELQHFVKFRPLGRLPALLRLVGALAHEDDAFLRAGVVRPLPLLVDGVAVVLVALAVVRHRADELRRMVLRHCNRPFRLWCPGRPGYVEEPRPAALLTSLAPGERT